MVIPPKLASVKTRKKLNLFACLIVNQLTLMLTVEAFQVNLFLYTG
jgi:hypothetical protein